jgi:hypothetical protein
MNTAAWPIFGVSLTSDREFVRFWDRLYTGYNEEVYQRNIRRPLTAEQIEALFVWKNGGPLSTKKRRSIRPYLSGGERIGRDAAADELRRFLTKPGGTVWRVFWLHLQHPERYPIYDQHVHRAMAFLLGWDDLEIPSGGSAKVRAYLESYLQFFDRFAGCNRRQVDRALWSFGRFLKPECNREAFREAVPEPPDQH